MSELTRQDYENLGIDPDAWINEVLAEKDQLLCAQTKRIAELEARLEIAGPYDGIAARDETIRLLEARLVEQTGSHNDLVIRKSDRITELSVQLAHAEADSELIDLLEKAIGPGHAAAIVTIANWRHSHPSASFRDAIAAILRAKS